MDKNIPLSELIRLGCKISERQCFDHMFNPGESCALGAAILGKTGGTPPPRLRDANKYYQEDDFAYSARILGQPEHELIMVARMNDKDHLTREQIADHLQSIGK
jgi:hypothetical protein